MMAAVKCINEPQVYVVRSVIVVNRLHSICSADIVVSITLLLNLRDNMSRYCSLSINVHGFVVVLIIKSQTYEQLRRQFLLLTALIFLTCVVTDALHCGLLIFLLRNVTVAAVSYMFSPYFVSQKLSFFAA